MATANQMKASERVERERRRALVAKLVVMRLNHSEIVRALKGEGIGVSRFTVAADIKLLEKRWLKEQAQSIDLVRARELRELDHMESQVARAWMNSGGDVATETFDKHGKIAKRVVEHKDPNPQFIHQRLAIKRRRAELLGLDAPEVSVSMIFQAATAELSSMSDEELALIASQGNIIDIEPDDDGHHAQGNGHDH